MNQTIEQLTKTRNKAKASLTAAYGNTADKDWAKRIGRAEKVYEAACSTLASAMCCASVEIKMAEPTVAAVKRAQAVYEAAFAVWKQTTTPEAKALESLNAALHDLWKAEDAEREAHYSEQ